MCAQVQQAAKQVGEQAEPIAKDITRGVIQPGAKLVAENAVPMTEQARITAGRHPPSLHALAHASLQC
jgi:hypothetical protein